MEARLDEFHAAGAEVWAVSFSPPDVVAKHLSRFPSTLPYFADPELTLYRSFALGRVSVWRLLAPSTLWRYARILVRGIRPGTPYPGDDVLQLGGDFVLDRDRRVRFAYSSSEPTDRPSVDAVLGAVRAIGGAS